MTDLTASGSVKRILRVTNEVPDSEVASFIKDTQEEIWRDYGYPPRIVHCWIDSDSEQYRYYLSRERRSIHSVDRVSVSGSILPTSSYTPELDRGYIDVGSEIVEGKSGSMLTVGYTPKIYEKLATFMVSRDLLGSMYLTSSEGGEFPRPAYLKRKIDTIRMEILGGDTIIRSSPYKDPHPDYGEYIPQDQVQKDL